MKFITKLNRNHMKLRKEYFASILALALLTTGTFAWQSFSQLATNEIIQLVDTPGARLHDYFNGSDKNVFIENYASGDNAPDVYARIRIAEYFEYGKDAGNLEANTNNITVLRGDIRGTSVPNINDITTWDIYRFGSTADEEENIRTYRDLELGGEVFYMPTFNQDNTDLKAEIKGSYRDDVGVVKEIPYDDYKSYAEEDEEMGYLVTATDIANIETIHKAQLTENAKAMSIDQWNELDEEEQIGDYWVFDTTGWAYYAKPIPSGSASGLLLDEITKVSTPIDEWYYAVEVKAQIATFGDWGDEASTEEGIGMYEDLTEAARGLLHKISGSEGEIKQELEESESLEDSEITQITGLSKDEITEMVGSNNLLKIGDLEYYVLDVDTIQTYSSSGEFEGEEEAVLLWMSEPLNDIAYTFSLSGNSEWYSSNIRAVLESVTDNDTIVEKLALRVDTTVEPYVGDASDSYDRLYLLSYEEFNETYQLSESQRAMSSSDVATYTWLRSPFMGTNVIMIHNINGSVNNFIEAQYIGAVRPVLWAKL